LNAESNYTSKTMCCIVHAWTMSCLFNMYVVLCALFAPWKYKNYCIGVVHGPNIKLQRTIEKKLVCFWPYIIHYFSCLQNFCSKVCYIVLLLWKEFCLSFSHYFWHIRTYNKMEWSFNIYNSSAIKILSYQPCE